MEQAEIQPLYDSYHRKIAKVDLRFKRYLYSQINWKARIISIKGARGPCNVVKGNKNQSTIRMLFLEGFPSRSYGGSSLPRWT